MLQPACQNLPSTPSKPTPASCSSILLRHCSLLRWRPPSSAPRKSEASSEELLQHLGPHTCPQPKRDCHGYQEKPNSFRAPAPAPWAPALPPESKATAIDPGRSPRMHRALALVPPAARLTSHQGSSHQCNPGEDTAHAHFRFSSPTKATGHRQTA